MREQNIERGRTENEDVLCTTNCSLLFHTFIACARDAKLLHFILILIAGAEWGLGRHCV